ncbi:hypothetical protein TEPIDINF_001497 [Tepidibacillus infernus]
MTKKDKKQQQQMGPSVTSKVTSEQQHWHTATSDDEEAFVNEMESLTKD